MVSAIATAIERKENNMVSRRYPTEEEKKEMMRYKEELKKRGISNLFLSYFFDYKHSYIKAIMCGIDPLSDNVRAKLNYLIDLVDSNKIKKSEKSS